jgi:hypothetical protein
VTYSRSKPTIRSISAEAKRERSADCSITAEAEGAEEIAEAQLTPMIRVAITPPAMPRTRKLDGNARMAL